MKKSLSIIEKHLIRRHLAISEIDSLLRRFEKHPEIAIECSNYLETGHYPTENPVLAAGYSAERIHSLSRMDGFWSYAFLLTLLDRPDVAQAALNSHFAEL